jgi:serine/threonine protein kinase
VLFRDIKAENVLIDLDGHIKLADFGLAIKVNPLSQEAFSYCGSPIYIAPEII